MALQWLRRTIAQFQSVSPHRAGGARERDLGDGDVESAGTQQAVALPRVPAGHGGGADSGEGTGIGAGRMPWLSASVARPSGANCRTFDGECRTWAASG